MNVLVIDDSAIARESMRHLLEPEGLIVMTAPNAEIAAEKISKTRPDVIILDINMPRIDGIEFLRRKLNLGIPVVVFSGYARGSRGMEALELGAVEAIQKPEKNWEEAKIVIYDAIKAAVKAKHVQGALREPVSRIESTQIVQKPVVLPRNSSKTVVVVGASTGGTEALKDFLLAMPPECPGIVIVQHMPAGFTSEFAKRLNGLCRIMVKEGADGDVVTSGKAIIAPGNRHILLRNKNSKYVVEIQDGPLVSRHRPSVDVLFRSAVPFAPNIIGVIMTGMGNDGAHGMLEMKKAGAYTIAQDEESCVVFGMPKEAIALGCVDEILSLAHIAPRVLLQANRV